MDVGFFLLARETGSVQCGLDYGRLLLAGADGLEMVLLVLLPQPLWLRRTELRSFLEVWRGLAVELLGLLFVVVLLWLARRMVLVFDVLVLVAGLLERLLVPALGWVGGTAGWLLALAVVDPVSLRCILQYHAAIRNGAGH